MINILNTIILGIIQGLTEFLPVSSSGHLVLLKQILGFEHSTDVSLEVILHLGSLLAVILFFRKDIISLITSIFKKDKAGIKTCLYLLTATIVTGFIGFAFKDVFEQIFANPIYAAVFFSVTGVILFISDKIKTGNLKQSQIGYKKSAITGLAQGLAILPGISRSGTTISCLLLLKVNRKDAARFSFLLSIPAILGANIANLDALKALPKNALIAYGIGALAAFISGYAVIALLLKIINKRKLSYFSYYLWVISIVSLGYFLT